MNVHVFEASRRSLADFVKRQADGILASVGVGIVLTDKAPEDYDSLRKALHNVVEHHLPWPVQSNGLSDTIYPDAHGNIAFRVWHDWLHYCLDADFSVQGETIVAMHQVRVVETAFGVGSAESKLMIADTLGQVLYYQLHGGFPENQGEYVKSLFVEF